MLTELRNHTKRNTFDATMKTLGSGSAFHLVHTGGGYLRRGTELYIALNNTTKVTYRKLSLK